MKWPAINPRGTAKCTDKELIEALKAANKEKQEIIDQLCDKLAKLDDNVKVLKGLIKSAIAKES